MKQSTALAILKTGQNVFLTGQAGAGKTYVLNQYINYLKARQVPIAITASTGIAATHMGGVTIHSWSGIGIQNDIEKINLSRLKEKDGFVDKLKNTRVLIVDEISMLHLKQVDTIDAVLRHFIDPNLPFGGLQVVFSGDFFQLPPVGEKGETSKEKYAFMSKAWIDCNFQICYLSEQHRQDDSRANQDELSLTDILNQIRSQTVSWAAIDRLKATQNNQVQAHRTRLYTHNIDVDRINDDELVTLSGKSVCFKAVVSGDKALIEMLLKGVRAPQELTLKVGAKVMFVKNMPNSGVYNGTMGVVAYFVGAGGQKYDGSSDIPASAYPVVRLNNGGEVNATPEDWTIEDADGGVLASLSQVPLCLAWAITIHKSQGMTLDAAEIDLSKTFEMGQGYVALSRLKSLDGLKLLGLNTKSLLLDEWVQRVDRRLLELSNEQEQQFLALDDKTVTDIHQDFIKVCGGLDDVKKISLNEQIIIKQTHQKRQQEQQHHDGFHDGVRETLSLVKEGLSISQIAQKRAYAESTIIGHLDKIVAKMPQLDYSAIRPEQSIIDAVKEAFEKLDAQGEFIEGIRLRPIFEELREVYSYNQIRLALVFIDKSSQQADKEG